MRKNELKLVYERLLQAYGEQGWWPMQGEYSLEFKAREKTSEEQFEIAVGAVLTQATSWKNVEKSLAELRKRDLLNPQKILQMPLNELAVVVKSSGYHTQKARKLKALAEFWQSGAEKSRENLLNVWGIGPETADSILLYAFNEPVFVIDAYTRRIITRLGLVKAEENYSYGELQAFFEENLPKDTALYNEYHALLVELGKNACRKKPECSACPLSKECLYATAKTNG